MIFLKHDLRMTLLAAIFSCSYQSLCFGDTLALNGPTNSTVPSDAKPTLAEPVEYDPTLVLQAKKLVAQLGASTFRERELAMSQLVAMGLPALSPIKKGLTDLDPEIRARSRRVFVYIRDLDRQRLINTLTSWNRSISESDFPGWRRYRELHGDSPTARKLYVEMLQSEWNLLENVFQHARDDAGQYVEARCIQIQNSGNYSRLNISKGTLAALLLAAGNDEVYLRAPTTLLGFCSRPESQPHFVRGEHQRVFKRLLGRLIGRRLDALAISQQLNLSLRYDLAEGLAIAREIAGDPAASGYARRTAVLLIAKLGTPHDVRVINPILDDRSFSNRSQSVQLCDVALAALVHMVGDEPATYGFTQVRTDSVMLYYTPSLRLKDETVRKEAIQKWRAKHQAKLAE